MGPISKRILLGKVSKPHGLKGELTVQVLSSDSLILREHLLIYLSENESTSFEIEKIRFGNKVIMKLQGFDSIEAVETLLPIEVWVEREDFPKLKEDEYYLCDFPGCHLVSPTGEFLGEVKNFYETKAQTVLSCKLKNGEVIDLPLIKDFFPHMDFETKTIEFVKPEYQ